MRRVGSLPRALELAAKPRQRLRPAITAAPSVGCSRWLSCTCCRPSDWSRSTPPPRLPRLETMQRMQMSHLPLPPPLPWSTDSPQFARHMQVLGQALLSTGDSQQGWVIYESLHPDLRPAIPDDVFIALLNSQLRDIKHEEAQARVIELLQLAHTCQMDPATLASETLENILSALLGRPDKDGHHELYDWLWPRYMRAHGESFESMPLRIRRRWLRYMTHYHGDDHGGAWTALEDIIDGGGGSGIHQEAEQAISVYQGGNPDICLAAIRQAAWCLARGVDISSEALERYIERLQTHLSEQKVNTVDEAFIRTVNRVGSLVEELRDGEAFAQADTLEESLDAFVASQSTPPSDALTALKLKGAKRDYFTSAKLDVSHVNLHPLLQLCVRSLGWDEMDNQYLLHIIIPSITEPPLDYHLLTQFVEATVVTGVINDACITVQLKHKLFRALLATDLTPRSYDAARKLYASLRRQSNLVPLSWVWDSSSVGLWCRLFNAALGGTKTHFASRLYEDLLGDGVGVPLSNAVALIQAIAQRPSSSRLVLLDRYIKDVLYDADMKTDELIELMASSLADTPQGAAFAFHIARRIDPNAAIPPAVIGTLIPQLALSRSQHHRSLALSLLDMLPPGKETVSLYRTALRNLNEHIRVADLGLESSIAVYEGMKKMESSSPEAQGQTISHLMVALCKLEHLDLALGMFRESVTRKVALTAVGPATLMLKLATSQRTAEAYEVERGYYAVTPKSANHRAVTHSHLAVDIVSGVPVDLSVFVGKDGKMKSIDGSAPMTRKFFKYLLDLQLEVSSASASVAAADQEDTDGRGPPRTPAPEPEQMMTAPTAAAATTISPSTTTTSMIASSSPTSQVTVAAANADAPPLSAHAAAVGHIKKSVQPLTRSWNEHKGTGEWMLDMRTSTT